MSDKQQIDEVKEKAAAIAEETAKKAAEGAASDLEGALNLVDSSCASAGESDDAKKNAKKTQTAAGVTGAVTGVAGGVMTFFATKAIKNAILDKAEQEAYDTFMNEIGNHIYCYIGGEEAGQYGDVITTSME